MEAQELIRRPLITEKATRLKEASNTVCFEVAVTAQQDRGRQAVEKLFGVKVVDVRRREPSGQVEAHGPVRRPAQGLEEGLRPARAGSEDRVLRGRVMACQEVQTDLRRQAVPDDARLLGAVSGPAGEEPDGRAAQDRRPQQPGPDDLPLHGRRPQAPLPHHRLPARQAGHPGQGRDRSSTTRTARRASRCCTTPTARSATSSRPTASRSARRCLGPDGGHRAGQRAAPARDPARHDDPQPRADAAARAASSCARPARPRS